MSSLLLTVPEAAVILNMTTRVLYDRIARGELPDEVVVKFGPSKKRVIRLSRPKLEAWLGSTPEEPADGPRGAMPAATIDAIRRHMESIREAEREIDRLLATLPRSA